MRRVGISRLVVGLVTALSVVLLGGASRTIAAPAPTAQGLTIAPAALTLDIPSGATDASTSFTITNHYAAPVDLSFGFEPDTQVLTNTPNLIPQLQIDTTQRTVEAGQSVTQTMTIHDSQQLAPGSQQLIVVVRQETVGSGAVGVTPSVRLPLTVIKESGAVSRLNLQSIAGSGFSLTMPRDTEVVVRNTGNMVAIPRGVVTITDPNGHVISQGTLNEASRSVTPGKTMTLRTPVTSLGSAWLPGVYKMTVQYGFGGDQPAQIASQSFVYVAWWHVLVAIILSMVAFWSVRYAPTLQRTILRKKTYRSAALRRRAT